MSKSSSISVRIGPLFSLSFILCNSHSPIHTTKYKVQSNWNVSSIYIFFLKLILLMLFIYEHKLTYFPYDLWFTKNTSSFQQINFHISNEIFKSNNICKAQSQLHIRLYTLRSLWSGKFSTYYFHLLLPRKLNIDDLYLFSFSL